LSYLAYLISNYLLVIIRINYIKKNILFRIINYLITETNNSSIF